MVDHKKTFEVVCFQCGIKFLVEAYRVNIAKFCSRKCHHDWTRGRFCGEKSPRWKRVKRICKWCGDEFVAPADAVRLGQGVFCSRHCWYKWSSKNRSGNNSPIWKGGVEKLCAFCGRVFTVKQSRGGNARFCSHKCYSKSKVVSEKERTCITCGKSFVQKRHEGVGLNCSKECQSNAATKQILRVCLQCGGEFTVNLYQVEQGWGQFCTRKCHGKWKSENLVGFNSPSWQGGLSFEPYCSKFNKGFKRRVREFFGNRCVKCHITEKENGQKLSVHHVNYDKLVCCNDNKPLFVALCRRHNTKANKDRASWELYYTKIIDKRYGGKCYFTKDEMKVIDMKRGYS